MEDKHMKDAKRQVRVWQIFGTFCFLAAVGLLVALLIVLQNVKTEDDGERNGQQNGDITQPQCASHCEKGEPWSQPDVKNPTVFQDLSAQEMRAVVEYLMAVPELNITPFDEAVVNSSYIYIVELQVPQKSAVLDFLDRSGQKPERSAKAVLFRGDLHRPCVEEYIVSPLPNPSHHEHVSNDIYTTYPIPFDSRPMSDPEYAVTEPLIAKVAEELQELLMESYDAGVVNCSDKCLRFDDITQVNVVGQGRQTWHTGLRDVEGRHLHPLGISILLDHPGSDVTQWGVAKIFYNGEMYSSVAELMTHYNNRNISILRLPFPDDNVFSTFQRRGEDPLKVNQKGPRMFESGGHRYKISGQHVSYMHWSFDFRLKTDSSLQVFDIQFKGERIAYEISLQDLVTIYSGYSPDIMSSYIMDRSFIITHFELVKGLDCPYEATYMNSYQLIDTSDPFVKKNVLCIFEFDKGSPLMRHYANDYDGGYTSFGGLKDYSLVLRGINAIYNYDYLIDIVFHTNGVVHLRGGASGNVLAAYDNPRERRYAFPIHRNVLGSLHHHMFGFKLDLDIQGEKNRFATYDITVETIAHPWFPSTNVSQGYFVKSAKKTEKEAKIMYDFNKPQFYVIYNENATNSFGSKRGYKIDNDGMSKMLLPDTNHVRAFRWGKYQLAVTKAKHTESTSSSMYALNSVMEPLVDFDQFLEDDESIEDEDLIVWAAMGTHHLPTSEDVPYTSIVTKSLYLRPFNYFDEDPAVSSRDAVYIVPDGDDKTVDINTYGRFDDPNCLPKKTEGPSQYDGTW